MSKHHSKTKRVGRKKRREKEIRARIDHPPFDRARLSGSNLLFETLPKVLVVFAVIGLIHWLFFQDAKRHGTTSQKSVSPYERYEIMYPHGMKIIEMTERGVHETSFDTMPESFSANWKRIYLSNVDPQLKYEMPDAVRLNIIDLRYPDEGIETMDIGTTLLRRAGEKAVILSKERLRVLVEVLESDDSRLLLLFALRKEPEGIEI